ncbi:MAG: Ig-like domain-containing protein [Gemmatimonadales bacterium]
MRRPAAPFATVALVASVLLSACGGGTSPNPPAPPPPPPPPPPPAAVASVTVAPGPITLVPQQTQTLAATVKDAAGNTLSGRTVTWATSAGGVATVSASGLVTAVAVGTATITATSEGQSGTAQVTVATGAVVGTTGGTVRTPDGSVEIVIPSGALAGQTTITATPLAQPSQALPADFRTIGPMYAFGPSGTTFSQPVTVRIKYDPAKLPKWVMRGDLALLHLSGGQWSTLTDFAIDTAAKIMSGKTTSFSDIGAGVEDPTVTMTPSSASVNATHRSVIFHVALTPSGEGMDVPATPTLPLRYRWSTSGQNGAISVASGEWTTTDNAQYTATVAVLDQLTGKIDDVSVDVLLNPESLAQGSTEPQRIVTVKADIDADLQLTYDLSPTSTEIGPGATAALEVRSTNKQGQAVAIPNHFDIVWESSAAFGTLTQGAATNATYTANSSFDYPPPRVDDVTVTVSETVTKSVRTYKPAAFGFEGTDEEDRTYTLERGKVKGFVEVKVNYQATLSPANDTLPIGGTVNLSVTVEPVYNGPGFMYRYSHTGSRGSIDLAQNTPLEDQQVRYTAKADGSGTGSDQVKVEVVSVVAGVVLEVVATGTATISIDDWLSGSFSVVEEATPGGAFVAARISIPKRPGATQYQLEVINNGQTIVSKTFSAAETTNTRSVGQIFDGGGAWRLNLAGGFATTPAGIEGRRNVYQTEYGNVKVRYKVP